MFLVRREESRKKLRFHRIIETFACGANFSVRKIGFARKFFSSPPPSPGCSHKKRLAKCRPGSGPRLENWHCKHDNTLFVLPRSPLLSLLRSPTRRWQTLTRRKPKRSPRWGRKKFQFGLKIINSRCFAPHPRSNLKGKQTMRTTFLLSATGGSEKRGREVGVGYQIEKTQKSLYWWWKVQGDSNGESLLDPT